MVGIEKKPQTTSLPSSARLENNLAFCLSSMLATGFHSVPKSSESETALLPAKKSQTRRQIFPLKKMTPMPFLLHFYVTIFPISSLNCKKKSIILLS